MTLETVKYRTNQKGCTLAETIHKGHIITPYVDIDRKVPQAPHLHAPAYQAAGTHSYPPSRRTGRS